MGSSASSLLLPTAPSTVGSRTPVQVALVAVAVPSPLVGGDSSSVRCGLGLGHWDLCWAVGSLAFTPAQPPPPAGRVARAGRSGTAYSLVAPDEVPYLLDLHLFLGRTLTLACPYEEPSGEWRLGQCGGLRGVRGLGGVGRRWGWIWPQEKVPVF